MKRTFESIAFDYDREYNSLLAFAAQSDYSIVLNPLRIREGFKTLYAFGNRKSVKGFAGKGFNEIEKLQSKSDTIFGYFSYDLKNEIEVLSSRNADYTDFPDYFFFQPKLILEVSENELLLKYFEEDSSLAVHFTQYVIARRNDEATSSSNVISLQPRITKEDYISTVNLLKKHIHRGDIYEVNFCQEFFAENAEIHPLEVYQKLLEKSPTPFASFLKMEEQYLLCVSPERFIQKQGNRVLSQPIKGTAKRSDNAQEDEKNKRALFESAKERSENVMIVDLVRNDLSTIANNGSVKVDELFKVYSFKQWHQMISTISCEVDNNISSLQIIKKCFPMGSMTGAPKVSAMRLIDENESMKRGIFSGAVGYIDENNNFDFNVVIRSLVYNAKTNYLSLCVGSAITAHCDAQQEYEECLLKAAVLKEVLQ
ncbi:MAG: chorismate-binding protein [Flavobacteriales bacterium]